MAKIKTRDQIALDFDGTLTAFGNHDSLPLPPPVEAGDVLPDGKVAKMGTRQFLEGLKAAGKHVTIVSHRPTGQIKDWLNQYGMADLVPGGVTNIKPEAAAYYDDRAVRHDGNLKKGLKRLTKKKYQFPWWKH